MEKIRELTLKIEGMVTPCCAVEVKEALLKVKGVKKASACPKRGIAEIEIEDEAVTTEQLIKVVEEAGFKAKVKEEGEEGELQELLKKFEIEFKKLAQKYNLPQKEVEEHWNLVKKDAAEVYQRCCEWSLGHGLAIKDAEAYCQSAMLVGFGKLLWAEQTFKIEPKVQQLTNEEIKNLVSSRYGGFAAKYALSGNPCPIRKKQVQDLYSEKELSLIPKTALNLALGCGNPTSFADLKSGEVVVDFGCGAGIDLILAAHKVGPEGRVIGVDLTPQMIEKEGQSETEAGFPAQRIEEHIGDIEKLKLPDSFADVVTSNCVIILTPNKKAAYKEAFRILKPGGRLAISDMLFSEKIDPEIYGRLHSAWAGGIGGGIAEKDYFEIVKEAGFEQIKIIKRHFFDSEEIFAMSTCPGNEFVPSSDPKDLEAIQGKVVSTKFTAVKP
ncbi:MAG: methyltransferase domain-containing protein [Proteobacteria bacterium]|nr:methyltransferase domain-containing protein [Patescibacteria group bacterium]MBU4056098.1 methyltransferase domain-containing protein [Pseudomonadota bacterium]